MTIYRLLLYNKLIQKAFKELYTILLLHIKLKLFVNF